MSLNGILSDFQIDMHWSGGTQFGSNSLKIGSDGVAVAKLFDTATWGIPGVGIFEARLDPASLNEVREISKIICTPGSQAGRRFAPAATDPAETFDVTCVSDGKIVGKSGSLSLIPQEMFDDVNKRLSNIFHYLVESGRKKIKFDMMISSIIQKQEKFEVGVDFTNTGEDVIKFKRPDLWSGIDRMETFEVGGLLIKNGKLFNGMGFNLAGAELTSPDDLPEKVELRSGQKIRMTFRAEPDDDFKKGEYAFGLVVWTNLELEGKYAGVFKADLTSDMKKRIHIMFENDYPSTPQEREQWEAKHRADMSFHPVKPGQRFVEDGLYRAVRMITAGDYRSLQLKPFKAGDVATTEGLRMFMQSEYGGMLNGQVQWVWEGSAPTPVKPFSPDIISETQHTCEAGAVCPRTGRWLARVHTGTGSSEQDYRYDLAGIVTRRRGERMPEIAGVRPSDYGRWEWLGV
jgi:hypothetical protein